MPETWWDVCWECFSRGSPLSCWHSWHSWNLLSFPYYRVLLQLWSPWKAIDLQDIEAFQRTFTYKITEGQHLNILGKTTLTQIILSPGTPWTLYNHIYLEGNTAYGAKHWWNNGTQNKNQKTSKKWNTVCVIQYPTNRNPAQSLQENAITVVVGLGSIISTRRSVTRLTRLGIYVFKIDFANNLSQN